MGFVQLGYDMVEPFDYHTAFEVEDAGLKPDIG